MLNIQEIKEKLQDRRPNIVCSATGLSYGTIQAIRDGKNTNPTLNVVKSLSDYLEGVVKDGEHI